MHLSVMLLMLNKISRMLVVMSPLLRSLLCGSLDHNYHRHYHVGCQASAPIDKYIVKDPKKLNLPFYEPSKMALHNFSMKLHAALIDCNMGYLLTSTDTNPSNAQHSKELIV
jgi:hypothetical protein